MQKSPQMIQEYFKEFSVTEYISAEPRSGNRTVSASQKIHLCFLPQSPDFRYLNELGLLLYLT